MLPTLQKLDQQASEKPCADIQPKEDSFQEEEATCTSVCGKDERFYVLQYPPIAIPLKSAVSTVSAVRSFNF